MLDTWLDYEAWWTKYEQHTCSWIGGWRWCGISCNVSNGLWLFAEPGQFSHSISETTGSFDSWFSWFSVILIKLHEKGIMTSVVCYVNIRVYAAENFRYSVIGGSTANAARGNGCSVHTTRFHGPCWQKALHDNVFFRTAREHGPFSRVTKLRPCSRFTAREHC